MKKLLSTLIIIAMLFTLAACSTDTTKTPGNEPETESSTIENQESKKVPIWERTVTYDAENNVEFFETVDEPGTLYVMCNFDGKEPNKEYGRVNMIISLLQYYNVDDIFMLISSGKETGSISYTDGEAGMFNYLPSTYETADTSDIINEGQVLMDTLKDVLK